MEAHQRQIINETQTQTNERKRQRENFISFQIKPEWRDIISKKKKKNESEHWEFRIEYGRHFSASFSSSFVF